MLLQALNTQTNIDLSLDGPVGQVYAMTVINDLLFAGTQVTPLTSITFLVYYMFSFSLNPFSWCSSFGGLHHFVTIGWNHVIACGCWREWGLRKEF